MDYKKDEDELEYLDKGAPIKKNKSYKTIIVAGIVILTILTLGLICLKHYKLF